MSNVKQLSETTKTAGATLTYAEMGDIVVNSANATTQVLPSPVDGLWYRIGNVGEGLVTVNDGSSDVTTLRQDEQCLLLANGTTGWYMTKGGGEPDKTVFMAAWSSEVTYAANGWCTYGGKVYKSLQSNNLNQQPDISPTYWSELSGGGGAGVNWMGSWSSVMTYSTNDAVEHNGSSYMSLIDNNLNNLPTDDTKWAIIAEKGDKGDTWVPTKGSGTITTTGWEATGAADYAYKLVVAAAGVTANNFVFIAMDRSKYLIAAEAELSDSVDTGADTITFYANQAPSQAIPFTYGMI